MEIVIEYILFVWFYSTYFIIALNFIIALYREGGRGTDIFCYYFDH